MLYKKKYDRSIKSFVRRLGRITKKQKRAIKEYYNLYSISYDNKIIELDQCYTTHQPIIIEIGYGMGDSLIEEAERKPNINFLGIEVYDKGIGNILHNIYHKNILNLLIIKYDAVDVLKNMISDNELIGIQIFFPDPWHKNRHHKRRLINDYFINLILTKIKANGFIHIVTDCKSYADNIIKIVKKNIYIKNIFYGYKKNDHRLQTNFEKKAIKLNKDIWDIFVEKK